MSKWLIFESDLFWKWYFRSDRFSELIFLKVTFSETSYLPKWRFEVISFPKVIVISCKYKNIRLKIFRIPMNSNASGCKFPTPNFLMTSKNISQLGLKLFYSQSSIGITLYDQIWTKKVNFETENNLFPYIIIFYN